jgi:Flp pilus assembly secretin CpaC
VALRGLQTRSEELAEPEAVTLSGRQTQMRATEVINVVTNFFLKEMGTNVAIMPQIGQAETGPFLDTIPYVLSDGYTINLTTVVSVTRFLGYSSPTNTKTAFTSSGEKVSLPSILPVFDTHQAHASLNLWDDQTLVMEAIDPSPFQGSIDSDVPMLDDLPPIGDVVRNPGKTSPPKELLVFVTVTLVDPAGNRVHSEDELPFAETEIPPQPPQPNQSDSSLIIP